MIAPLLRVVLVTAALLTAAPNAGAEVLRKVIEELVETPSSDAAVDQTNAAALARFQEALAVYDRQIEQQPTDVVTRLERCRFIEDFAANYEIADFAEKVSEQGEECQTQFDEAFPDHPETQLRQLQASSYGKSLEPAEKVLADARLRATWTSGQLGRLYSLLAQMADRNDQGAKALQYALLALECDEESAVRLIAATRLIARGDRVRALEILRAPVDGIADDQNGWELVRKMKLLSQAGAPQEAIALHARLKQTQYYDHTEAAEVLLAAGAIAPAREELQIAIKDSKYTARDEGALFRLELSHGTAKAALAAYQAWRDLGWKVDPLGINRVALFVRNPTLTLQMRDFLGVLVLLGVGLALAFVAGVPMAAVHYRGLAVRARTSQPYPQADWPLRKAWLALTVFLICGVLALYFGGALDLQINATVLWNFQPSPEQFSHIGLASSMLGLAAMMPFAALRREGTWWATQWSIGKCLLIGAAIAVALRSPLLLMWAAKPDAIRSFALDDVVQQMLDAVQGRYGLLAAVWILAVAAPVTEEFLFRGVLYRAFLAHLRPFWANALQAALFSAMHLANLRGSIVLFIVGLTLGTLTRRSGGLLAAMTLHAIFNLIVGLIILRGS